MTTYNVHIYREMRLTFEGIEAKTSEAAAAIARDKPTGDADDSEDCEGETFTALIDIAGDTEYENSVFIDFEAERQRKAVPKLLAVVQAVAELRRKWRSQDEAETIGSIEYMDGLDSLDLDAAVTNATAASPPREAAGSYSVLLLYPDYINDGGTDTYYAFVVAADPMEAVLVAQQKAAAAQAGVEIEPNDFAPLLVTQGHHFSEPLFNK